MADAEDHEVSADRPTLAGALVPPFSRHGRLNSRLRMELGDQLCALIVEEGVRPATMRDIQVDGSLVHMWIGMLCDMYSLMWHVVGATTLVTQLRRTVARYRRGRAAARDGQSVRNNSSHDHSPRTVSDEHEAPLASSSHHGDEAGPSATSS